MSDVKDEVTKEIMRYKPVKILIIGFLSLLLLVAIYSFIYHTIRCVNGKNDSLFWGMQECKECVIKNIDSITKHDTFRIIEHDTFTKTVTRISGGRAQSPTPSIQQKNDAGNNTVYQNTGTNSGIMGPNATQNFFGPPQPHPTPELVEHIKKRFPNPKDGIWLVYGFSSPISKKFAEELADMLRPIGYYVEFVVDATHYTKKGLFVWPNTFELVINLD